MRASFRRERGASGNASPSGREVPQSGILPLGPLEAMVLMDYGPVGLICAPLVDIWVTKAVDQFVQRYGNELLAFQLFSATQTTLPPTSAAGFDSI